MHPGSSPSGKRSCISPWKPQLKSLCSTWSPISLPQTHHCGFGEPMELWSMGLSYRDGSISSKAKGQRVGRENLEGNSRYCFIQRRRGGLTVVIQSLSRDSLSPTFCHPMDCSTPGFPVLHYLPELAQTHVQWLSDAIQPSHPVASFSSCFQSLPASGSFPMSQLFTSGGQSIGASVHVCKNELNTDWAHLSPVVLSLILWTSSTR